MVNTDGVWILGNNIVGVDKCIQWDSDIPNFADCNVLIVDMTTLDKDVLHNREYEKIRELFEGILARYKTGLFIYCIFTESFSVKNLEGLQLANYTWCPIQFTINKTKPGKTWNVNGNFGFNEYLQQMKSWNLVFDEKCTLLRKDVVSYWDYSQLEHYVTLSSKSDEIIGGIFYHHNSEFNGKLYMFPPINDTNLGIKLILEEIGIKSAQKEIAPQWIEKISIPGVSEIKQEISDENSKIEKISLGVTQLKEKQNQLEKYQNLLFAEGDELEEIVSQTFNELGFSNVRKGRPKKVEDLLFDLSTTKYDICVVEVKSSEKNMSIDDVRQSLNWALDYHETNKPKALLVANIYRKDEFPKYRSQRESFKNFEDFSQKYDICILPTTILFDLICKKLEGKSIDAKKLEGLITDTKGVLIDVANVIT